MKPLSAPSTPVAASEKEEGEGLSLIAPINILIVDDEPRNLDVLESILYSSEYNLVRAGSADEALMALVQKEFAVLVLDINMPGTNGIELATLIKQRKRTQHVPILFLTAYYQDEKYVLEGYNAGAVDYLTKPVSPQILRSKVEVFVDLHKKTEALARSNKALETEIQQREQAEDLLRRANAGLEERVDERTQALRKVNGELAEARDLALAASQAKDEFLAALSHELRTPLSPVLLLASEAANDAGLSEETRGVFSTIRKNVEFEARLIDDLLDLTRITSGKLLFEIHPHDIHAILRDAVGILSEEFEQKKITLVMRFEEAERVIHADEVRLQQVFWNILKNGIKFTPEGGTITVETGTNGNGRIFVRISDTGIGITRDEMARIFHPFTQGDHAHKKESIHRFGGLGLGLAISKALIENQGGCIQVESEGANRGATFTVEFPLASKAPVPKPAGNNGSEPSFADAAKGRQLRILLVEDHKPTRQALSHLLVRRHFEVVSSPSLAEARIRAGEGKFDLLISDIGLPDGDGYHLMAELRERLGLQGIALSGYGMEQDIQRSKEAGFLIHLTKPIHAQTLDAALAKIFIKPEQTP
jgi:signal transduction histidine kinase